MTNRLGYTAQWVNCFLIAVIFNRDIKALMAAIPEPGELTALWHLSDEGPLRLILSMIMESDPTCPEVLGGIRAILMGVLSFSEPLTDSEIGV